MHRSLKLRRANESWKYCASRPHCKCCNHKASQL